ncbi:S41 family peptidase [Tepidibacter formicigenes]|jgi:carboxyl-terminal processing protease|uniref:Carboxyl-terminal processing protease n=1 Tax=Tepidibacter formicigenes DSM 15518 TaxID=1123349 RepID=A0A1M6SYN7_9FIRM|nr:S41 family peptidase [Tepidibacter formicigenes]SHK49777.1 carboxyl-terminal processing protease [Tepidibacter formicigenes DSM 15518]
MISKKKAAIWGSILVLLTSLITVNVQLVLGDKVLVSRKVFEEYNKFSKLYSLKKVIEENYYTKVNEEDLINGATKGLFEGLNDPYSQYMTKKEFEDLMEYTHGSYSGIGVIVMPGEDGLITVVSPIEDTPGFRAGIKAGDKIVKVNGKDVTAKEMDKAISMMKGKKGTKVIITILRESKEPFDLTIKREEIRLKTVKSQVLEDNIGYIRITTFDEKTAGDFKKNLKELQSKNIKGLIIDLRDNPGGLLDQCQKIADELIGEGTIVYTKDNKGKKEYLKSDAKKVGIPLALLVNKGSASASEILSGAVRDNKEGVLIGTTTFGKGLVQRVKPLKDGSGFKLTIAQYFTPNGEYIHGKGIKPDIVVEKVEEQLPKAIEYIKEQIK